MILDLGLQPVPTRFPSLDDPPDPVWPLLAAACRACRLLQLIPAGAPEELDETGLLGLASMSSGLAAHARDTARALSGDLGLEPASRIVELGSHGNHLRHAFEELGLRTTIVEPDPAVAARMGGPRASVVGWRPGEPLDADIAAALGDAELIVDDFLLAHLPDLGAAVAGLAALLRPGGALVLTVDHALSVVAGVQFDALRHGHHAVFSLLALEPLLLRQGLVVEDAVMLPVYGGSLRVVARGVGVAGRPRAGVAVVREAERAEGLDTSEAYRSFGAAARRSAATLRAHLVAAAADGRRVVGYGAPSRAATLLTAAGVGPDLLPYTVDRALAKQGRRLPGSGVPIRALSALLDERPDEILILAWPMAAEIAASLPEVEAWGGRFVVPLPVPTVLTPAVSGTPG